ncbi:hypothetical protein CR513_02957, partial [Mucuna pruriens]
MSQVKDSKFSMLVYQFELFKMTDHESIDKMFGWFQIIWRPQVIALRASKDLKKFPIEEHLGTLKVHVKEIKEDKEKRKGKFMTLKAQKASKKISSKAFKAKESSDESFEKEDSGKDESSLI